MSASPELARDSNRIPGSDALPSTWPKELRDRAKATTEAIILRWSREVRDQSRDFAIIYVPRAKEMHKSAERQDSWKHWLETFCADNDITFIDPSPTLIEAESRGEEVFYDHFTEHGHQAFAESFVKWFRESYPQVAKQ